MRELHLTITCDHCGMITDEELAEVVTLATSSGDYEMDLCSQCLEELLEPLRPAPKKRRAAKVGEQLQCPDCERTFGSQRGLTKHAQSAHLGPLGPRAAAK